ncbi:hypothetical protein M2360_000904 [Rhizobium sp. SG_E_25_P2]|uniref:hypothetical protein n=1 Tax=Rhizobium sp. SG_E_25_P2 TaxID=2879942 RepID=UPI00247642E2|nr:hypothetical protein [Rhizobium sp. SG_E_25_P2]MDH6265514.1 hypothetical protein [Rhizobium sp. SG_E_25_P2]
MLEISQLLTLADEYARLCVVEEKTVSSRVFDDGKKLRALRGGSDITVGRFNAAMQWFSDNWPEGADWPASVARPAPRALEAAE